MSQKNIEAEMTQVHVSDLITKEEIKTWNSGEKIFISAGTGKGKSHFAKNTLYEFSKESDKKILLVLQRKRTLAQFENEIPDYKRSTISLYLYQWLEQLQDDQRNEMLKNYDYIVVDEAHYFLSDSNFNHTTDKSLDAILSSDATIIFMTATSQKIKRYLTEIKKLKLKNYDFDSQKVIGSLQFYQDDDALFEKLNEILRTLESKAAVFCGSAQKASQLHQNYKEDSIFECSDQNRYSNQRSIAEIDAMIKNKQFDKKFLFATASLDTGFNLEDIQLNAIFIDNITDLDTLIQFIGRKRMLSEYDTLSLFIRIPTRKTIGTHLAHLSSLLNHANQLLRLGEEAYECFYERNNDKSDVVYFDHLTRQHKIIYTVYYGALWRKADLLKMREDDGTKWIFARMVWDALKPQFAPQMSEEFSQDDVLPTTNDKILTAFLKQYANSGKVWFTKKDKIALYDSLNQKVNGRIIHSVKTINHLLECRYGLPYRLEQFSLAEVVKDSEDDKKPEDEKEKIKVYSAIKVIDASNQITTNIEDYLRMCYTERKIWYGASEWKAEGEIVDTLRFTDKNGRVFQTANKINDELAKRKSRYRIRSYMTTHKIHDINNVEHRHTTAAWIVIKAKNKSD